jgi:NAD-dependent deacetylase
VPLDPLPPRCPSCGGLARPAIVWFGEAIPAAAMRAAHAAADCDVFLSIGTSSMVYPAAGLLAEARARGAFTVAINPEPTGAAVDAALAMPAEIALPLLSPTCQVSTHRLSRARRLPPFRRSSVNGGWLANPRESC